MLIFSRDKNAHYVTPDLSYYWDGAREECEDNIRDAKKKNVNHFFEYYVMSYPREDSMYFSFNVYAVRSDERGFGVQKHIYAFAVVKLSRMASPCSLRAHMHTTALASQAGRL